MNKQQIIDSYKGGLAVRFIDGIETYLPDNFADRVIEGRENCFYVLGLQGFLYKNGKFAEIIRFHEVN
jgi:hypothetical protein